MKRFCEDLAILCVIPPCTEFSNFHPSRPAHLQLSKVFLETQSELSLIGEIDGYVGLLLGISINQMTNLLDIIVNAIARIYSHFKFLR